MITITATLSNAIIILYADLAFPLHPPPQKKATQRTLSRNADAEIRLIWRSGDGVGHIIKVNAKSGPISTGVGDNL